MLKIIFKNKKKDSIYTILKLFYTNKIKQFNPFSQLSNVGMIISKKE